MPRLFPNAFITQNYNGAQTNQELEFSPNPNDHGMSGVNTANFLNSHYHKIWVNKGAVRFRSSDQTLSAYHEQGLPFILLAHSTDDKEHLDLKAFLEYDLCLLVAAYATKFSKIDPDSDAIISLQKSLIKEIHELRVSICETLEFSLLVAITYQDINDCLRCWGFSVGGGALALYRVRTGEIKQLLYDSSSLGIYDYFDNKSYNQFKKESSDIYFSNSFNTFFERNKSFVIAIEAGDEIVAYRNVSAFHSPKNQLFINDMSDCKFQRVFYNPSVIPDEGVSFAASLVDSRRNSLFMRWKSDESRSFPHYWSSTISFIKIGSEKSQTRIKKICHIAKNLATDDELRDFFSKKLCLEVLQSYEKEPITQVKETHNEFKAYSSSKHIIQYDPFCAIMCHEQNQCDKPKKTHPALNQPQSSPKIHSQEDQRWFGFFKNNFLRHSQETVKPGVPNSERFS